MWVVDASVALAWCFDDERSEVAEGAIEQVLAEGGLAPPHWPLEVANAIRNAERRGRIEASAVPRLRTLLAGLPVDVHPLDIPEAMASIDLARDFDLSVYDAAYLQLAMTRGIGLLTIDERLATACTAAGIRLWGDRGGATDPA
jgi:predicted nucleic acid-binding protein